MLKFSQPRLSQVSHVNLQSIVNHVSAMYEQDKQFCWQSILPHQQLSSRTEHWVLVQELWKEARGVAFPCCTQSAARQSTPSTAAMSKSGQIPSPKPPKGTCREGHTQLLPSCSQESSCIASTITHYCTTQQDLTDGNTALQIPMEHSWLLQLLTSRSLTHTSKNK